MMPKMGGKLMGRIIEICPHVYQVGGNSLSYPEDCCVYIVNSQGKSVLIDTGAGASADLILKNIAVAGIKPESIEHIVVTHGHIDHIGGLEYMVNQMGAKVAAHRLELPAIEEGLPHLTAAEWYGVKYKGVKVDTVLEEPFQQITVGNYQLEFVHIPGHTVGSIAAYADIDGQRVLFGQDIHGPFNREWGSDISQWRVSMQRLIDLKADILCEGHFGIYSPAEAIKNYIQGYLQRIKR
jgi:glyoxylase-like metal-dependent hydrolase (beta-lactamase superfamily II)